MDNTVRLSASDHLPLRACPLCECHVSTPVFQTIRKCRSCGLSFVSPLGHFHGENETEEYFVSDYLPLHQANWQNSLAERRAHLALIQRYSSLPSQPRLLDVGCALGFMLQEAKSPVGMPSAWKRRGSLHVTRQSVPDARCTKATYKTRASNPLPLTSLLSWM
jgi:hypothetical protein